MLSAPWNGRQTSSTKGLEVRRSLLSLIGFCAVSVLVTAIGLVMLFAGATVLLAVAHTLQTMPDDSVVSASTQAVTPAERSAVDSSNSITFSGVISDDHCGAKHDMGSGKSAGECARTCVRGGQHFEIVNGDKAYLLTGRDDLTVLAGERVTVTGTLTGNTIKISSISSEE
jgi:hypothetical protein